MSQVREVLEHMEHAGHGGHGGSQKGSAKSIGITMALLGVMLAFCAAMVGSERTDLIKTMVEQSNRWGIYQAETTKLRVIEGDLEVLKALTPSAAEARRFDDMLRAKRAASGKEDSEDTSELKDLIASSLGAMTTILAPDQGDIDHFKKLRHIYRRDAADAKENAEAYEDAIKAHENAAEWYERAQLAAEVGIVVASVALLLGSRRVWGVSVVCGLAGAGIIAFTAYTEHARLSAAEQRIAYALAHEAEITSVDREPGTDDSADPKENAAAPAASAAPSAAAASGHPPASPP